MQLTVQKKTSLKLYINMKKVKEFYTCPLRKVSLSNLVLPKGRRKENHLLNQWFSRLMLKKTIEIMQEVDGLWTENELDNLNILFDYFLDLPKENISTVVRRPEFTSLIFYMEELINSNSLDKLNILKKRFIEFFFLILVPLCKKLPPIAFDVSNTKTIHLFQLHLKINIKNPSYSQISLQVNNNALQIRSLGKVVDEFTLPLKPEEGTSISIKSLCKVNEDTSCNLISKDNWYDTYFPSSPSSREAILDLDDLNFKDWSINVSSGSKLFKTYWQEGWEEFRENIFQIMPLKPDGYNPFNYSNHGFRGLILTSNRPSYMLAQTLAHETGHNKFSTILDLYKLANNPHSEHFYSPFVRKNRPINFIFHGVFSFLQEQYLSMKMIGNVNELRPGSIERYMKKIALNLDTALNTLKSSACLTSAGEEIMTAFNEMYELVSS